ncbi:MAG: OmpH family outer membrane protein [Xanthomonadaceae bacterium]|nr:OmpH family outer membrane protein [Xanthomonadaceae bacterium]
MFTKLKISTTGLLAASLLAAAPMAAVAQDMKIGVVNLNRLQEQAPQAQAAQATLEREFADRQRDLLAEQRAVTQLQERLQREADTIADPAEAARLERDLRTRQRDFQRNAQQFEEDLNIRRNEELARFQRQVFDEIQVFSREESFDVVLAQGVLYHSERVDVTDRILQRLQRAGGGRR